MIDLTQIQTGAYSNIETLQSTYELTQHALENIKGDLVECGVGAGSQIAVMKNTCTELGQHANIWAFDSYQGIPMASINDNQQPGIKYFTDDDYRPDTSELVSSGITAHSMENVQNNLTKWCGNLDGFKFVEGWFQDTLPVTKIKKIALLRLDGDLYDSTKVCLEYLFPKLVKGGILIIDDWALPGCKKACMEYFRNVDISSPHKIPNSNPVWFKKL